MVVCVKYVPMVCVLAPVCMSVGSCATCVFFVSMMCVCFSVYVRIPMIYVHFCMQYMSMICMPVSIAFFLSMRRHDGRLQHHAYYGEA